MPDKLIFEEDESFARARAKIEHNRWVDNQRKPKPDSPKRGCFLIGAFLVFATILTVAFPHVKL